MQEIEIEAAKVILQILHKPLKNRKFYDYALLENMLQKIKYFQNRNLSLSEISQISKFLIPLQFNQNDIILEDKSVGGDFYIILLGKVSIQMVKRTSTITQNATSRIYQQVADLGMGDTFGELAAISGKRSARVVAEEQCSLAMLPQATFEKILLKKDIIRLRQIVNFLLSTPYFKKCHERNIHLTQYYFNEEQYNRGQIVCCSGEPIESLYLVLNGEFEVRITVSKENEIIHRKKERMENKDKKKVKKGARGLGRLLRIKGNKESERKVICNAYSSFCITTPREELMEISVKKMSMGELFGHDDLLNGRKCYTSTLKCNSLNAKLYRISKKDFNKWIRFLPGVEDYLHSEIRIHLERTNNYVKTCQKFHLPQLKTVKKKRIRISEINEWNCHRKSLSPLNTSRECKELMSERTNSIPSNYFSNKLDKTINDSKTTGDKHWNSMTDRDKINLISSIISEGQEEKFIVSSRNGVKLSIMGHSSTSQTRINTYRKNLTPLPNLDIINQGVTSTGIQCQISCQSQNTIEEKYNLNYKEFNFNNMKGAQVNRSLININVPNSLQKNIQKIYKRKYSMKNKLNINSYNLSEVKHKFDNEEDLITKSLKEDKLSKVMQDYYEIKGRNKMSTNTSQLDLKKNKQNIQNSSLYGNYILNEPTVSRKNFCTHGINKYNGGKFFVETQRQKSNNPIGTKDLLESHLIEDLNNTSNQISRELIFKNKKKKEVLGGGFVHSAKYLSKA